MSDQEIIELILKSVRIVGFEIIGCSECPFSSFYYDGMGCDDINISDPDEGHYNCRLIAKHEVWGENPVCSDKDWVDYFRDLIIDEVK